jgi:hypothetical protein
VLFSVLPSIENQASCSEFVQSSPLKCRFSLDRKGVQKKFALPSLFSLKSFAAAKKADI